MTMLFSCKSHPCEMDFQDIVEQAVYEKFELESQQQDENP
jgi:hypothetical protein